MGQGSTKKKKDSQEARDNKDEEKLETIEKGDKSKIADSGKGKKKKQKETSQSVKNKSKENETAKKKSVNSKCTPSNGVQSKRQSVTGGSQNKIPSNCAYPLHLPRIDIFSQDESFHIHDDNDAISLSNCDDDIEDDIKQSLADEDPKGGANCRTSINLGASAKDATIADKKTSESDNKIRKPNDMQKCPYERNSSFSQRNSLRISHLSTELADVSATAKIPKAKVCLTPPHKFMLNNTEMDRWSSGEGIPSNTNEAKRSLELKTREAQSEITEFSLDQATVAVLQDPDKNQPPTSVPSKVDGLMCAVEDKQNIASTLQANEKQLVTMELSKEKTQESVSTLELNEKEQDTISATKLSEKIPDDILVPELTEKRKDIAFKSASNEKDSDVFTKYSGENKKGKNNVSSPEYSEKGQNISCAFELSEQEPNITCATKAKEKGSNVPVLELDEKGASTCSAPEYSKNEASIIFTTKLKEEPNTDFTKQETKVTSESGEKIQKNGSASNVETEQRLFISHELRKNETETKENTNIRIISEMDSGGISASELDDEQMPKSTSADRKENKFALYSHSEDQNAVNNTLNTHVEKQYTVDKYEEKQTITDTSEKKQKIRDTSNEIQNTAETVSRKQYTEETLTGKLSTTVENNIVNICEGKKIKYTHQETEIKVEMHEEEEKNHQETEIKVEMHEEEEKNHQETEIKVEMHEEEEKNHQETEIKVEINGEQQQTKAAAQQKIQIKVDMYEEQNLTGKCENKDNTMDTHEKQEERFPFGELSGMGQLLMSLDKLECELPMSTEESQKDKTVALTTASDESADSSVELSDELNFASDSNSTEQNTLFTSNENKQNTVSEVNSTENAQAQTPENFKTASKCHCSDSKLANEPEIKINMMETREIEPKGSPSHDQTTMMTSLTDEPQSQSTLPNDNDDDNNTDAVFV